MNRKIHNFTEQHSCLARQCLRVLQSLLICLSCHLSAARAEQVVLPDAEKILDEYVQATGGMTAYDKISNRLTKSTMEIAGTGIKISITLYQAKPLKSYSLTESAVTGKLESGISDQVVWDLSATAGPQIREGKDKENQLHLHRMDRIAYWRNAFQQVETAGMEEVTGKPCYKVVAKPSSGPLQTLYFDQDTHLLIKVATALESSQGVLPVHSLFSDYQAADGVLLPRKSVVKIATQERIVTINSIEQNIDLPADRFDPPAEIKALLLKKKTIAH